MPKHLDRWAAQCFRRIEEDVPVRHDADLLGIFLTRSCRGLLGRRLSWRGKLLLRQAYSPTLRFGLVHARRVHGDGRSLAAAVTRIT